MRRCLRAINKCVEFFDHPNLNILVDCNFLRGFFGLVCFFTGQRNFLTAYFSIIRGNTNLILGEEGGGEEPKGGMERRT